jgi:hypothetical protein
MRGLLGGPIHQSYRGICRGTVVRHLVASEKRFWGEVSRRGRLTHLDRGHDQLLLCWSTTAPVLSSATQDVSHNITPRDVHRD